MGSSINLALPQIAREFTLNGVEQSWLLTAYLLSTAILQVPFGRASDIFGKRRIFVTGLIIFILSTIGCGFAYNGLMLTVCRAIQGVGSAMVFCTNTAIISLVFPASERGMAMGVNVAMVYISLAIGPSVGGFITQSLGWEWVFFITAAIATISLSGAFVVMKERWAETEGEPFDMRGAVIYGFAVLALIYGLTLLPHLVGFTLIVASLLLFWFFARRELKIKYPVFNVHLLATNRIFRMSSAAALINYAATYPIGFLLSLYLQEIRVMSVRDAGLLLIVQPVVQTILSPFAGKLSDRFQPRIIASAGMAMIAVTLLAVAFIKPETPLWVLIAALALMGIGFAAFSSPNTNAIMGSVERRYYSMASATTGTVRLVGQAFSMGITTMIISLVIGAKAITPEVSDALMRVVNIVFVIFSVLCAFGVYTSMARGKR
jgi:EmrB/QacA subfamily drug resistance transporter